ncbi:MAG TPA: DUF2292 domain-containing protein [Gammaproteobacteria bacterium]
MNTHNPKKPANSRIQLQSSPLEEAVAALVGLTFHQGRVVQLEKRERTRLCGGIG